jgi:flagellar basal-body rod protein FlgB
VDLGGLTLFRMAEQRLAWLDRRQAVLARNVANADTPGFAARDLAPFAKVMARAAGPVLTRTSDRHILPSGQGQPPARTDRLARERTHDGNAVNLEDQMAKIAETETQHELTVGLYRKYIGLFRIALGRGG